MHVFYAVMGKQGGLRLDVRHPQPGGGPVHWSAFYSCKNLTRIVIPEGVTSIGYRAFDYCQSLTEVIIPDSVTSIGDYAFDSCAKLEFVELSVNVTGLGYAALRSQAVFYRGTEEQWEAINKYSNSVEKVYYYSESLPDEPGKYWRYVNGVRKLWVFL